MVTIFRNWGGLFPVPTLRKAVRYAEYQETADECSDVDKNHGRQADRFGVADAGSWCAVSEEERHRYGECVLHGYDDKHELSDAGDIAYRVQTDFGYVSPNRNKLSKLRSVLHHQFRDNRSQGLYRDNDLLLVRGIIPGIISGRGCFSC